MKFSLVIAAISLGFLSMGAVAAEQKIDTITSIYWSDADSGRINGNIKFRLNSVDAPETGGVGAAIGGAECELERERGYDSKEWIVAFTRNAEAVMSKEHGLDRYGRLVVDLSVNGKDLGQMGIETGYLKPWPHKGKKALSSKPDWCKP